MLYYGVAGSAAATLIQKATDIDLGDSKTFDDSTTRGNGTSVPRKTEQIVQLGREPSFKIRYIDGDATITALLAAEAAGTGVAIKIVAYSGGHTEFDGDVYLECNRPGPLTGGMELEFTCHPTDDYGRDWS